jgi:histidinol-phosphate aminotransferase
MIASPPASDVQHRAALEMVCPYQAGKPIEEVKRELGLDRVIKLASNENPLGPSPLVIEHLNRADLELHMYPDYEARQLRHDLGAFLGVAPEQILTGAGSVALMRVIADAFLDHGDEAILSDVCFPVYADVTRLAGATPIVVPVDDELQQDLERMLAAVTPRTKMVFLATPNNPTGRSIPAGDVEAFLDKLPERVLCVLDIAYWEYLAHADPAVHDPVRLLARHPNLMILRTFSKAFGLAGLRVGYLVAHARITASVARVQTPFSTSSVGQAATRIAMHDAEHMQATLALNQASLAAMTTGLTALGAHVWPTAANFLLADMHQDSVDLFDRLLRRGVIVRPQRHPRIRTTLRITSGTLDQTQVLLEAMAAEIRVAVS